MDPSQPTTWQDLINCSFYAASLACEVLNEYERTHLSNIFEGLYSETISNNSKGPFEPSPKARSCTSPSLNAYLSMCFGGVQLWLKS